MNHYQRELCDILADRDDIEAMNRAAFRAPRPVETLLVRPHAALFGTKTERDAFADKKLAEERAKNSAP